MKTAHLTTCQVIRVDPEGGVVFATRPRISVTCPRCWTEQRSERNLCYRCDAPFIYLDERQAKETNTKMVTPL
jgi:hypothetical protein